MRKKLVLSVAAVAAAVSVLVPVASNAAPARRSACVVIQRGMLNVQVGYAPNGKDDCTHL